MTFDEFANSVVKLEQFYEKEYNTTQKQVWYNTLKKYTTDRLNNAIDWLCTNSKFKPTLSDVLTAMQNNRYAKQEDEHTPCILCKGTGYFMDKYEKNGYMYERSLQCDCPNGDRVSYNGTTVADKSQRTQFYLAKGIDVYGFDGMQKLKQLAKKCHDEKQFTNNVTNNTSISNITGSIFNL